MGVGLFNIFFTNLDFYLKFCDLATLTDDHPQEELAKFLLQFRQETQKKFKNHVIFWWPAGGVGGGTYCLNTVI